MTGPASVLESRRHGGLSEFSSGRGKDSDCGDAEGERAAAPACCCRYRAPLGPFLNHQSQAHLDGAGRGRGRGGQQFKMLVLPSPDRPLLPGPRPEKKLEKVVGGSGENTLK